MIRLSAEAVFLIEFCHLLELLVKFWVRDC